MQNLLQSVILISKNQFNNILQLSKNHQNVNAILHSISLKIVIN